MGNCNSCGATLSSGQTECGPTTACYKNRTRRINAEARALAAENAKKRAEKKRIEGGVEKKSRS
jgi:hypothetical protein